MPPKIYDTRPTQEEIESIEAEIAQNARAVVATFSEDYFDGVTLMSMLGVEPEGLVYKYVAEELGPAEEEKPATKAAAKKTTKKAAAKKTTKKTTAKKTTAKKAAAKKTTKKTT
ncbi:hypothetical protein [Corynebacterium guangdongense]|uniref:Histone n=1 Tax=Corynebacterium guangdongense TaxID=1783348 RepID=A0ABU2A0U5_9CORY|nr:hypothetical protein [Corynebacterium guangdongense]MDR7330253.1 hypothetical protein [Corynebacterium guangdongense]WJZ18811.1 hypothetical protein CGUA_11375 [Corynebacterium guangdongense]